jgi:hypothetical protein
MSPTGSVGSLVRHDAHLDGEAVVSIRLVVEVLDHYHGPKPRKLWLLSFAESANDKTRRGWLPRQRLAHRVGVSVSRASKIAAELVKEGVLKRDGGGYSGSPARYVLLPLADPPRDDTRAHPSAEQRVTSERILKGAFWSQEGDIRGDTHPSMNPSRDPSRGTKTFQQFWKAYPRPVGRAAAAAAWSSALVGGGDPEVILDAVARFARRVGATEPQFICAPARWLEERRWCDDLVDAIKVDLPRRDPREGRIPGSPVRDPLSPKEARRWLPKCPPTQMSLPGRRIRHRIRST